MNGRGAWGRAGVRLSPREQQQRRQQRARDRALAAARVQRAEREAHADWRHGRLIPHRITMVLDAAGLYGPDVDAACGAQEPDVDNWEAGRLYPTFEQVLALADLVGVLPTMLFQPVPVVDSSSLRFHLPARASAAPDPILRYAPEVVAATLGTLAHERAPEPMASGANESGQGRLW